MSVTIEHWRMAIGRFSGGNSGMGGTSASVKPGSVKRSAGCVIIGLCLAALILSPLLLAGWSYLPSSSTRQCSSTWSTWRSGMSSHDQVLFPRVSGKKMNQLTRAINGNRSNSWLTGMLGVHTFATRWMSWSMS